jgi:hypothetical protein
MSMNPRLLKTTASGFSPRSISGLALWLDASDSSTLFQNSDGTVPATASSDPVGSWGDRSGNGRHAVQATAGSRPLVSTAAINSRNALLLDGSNDLLNLGNLASAFPSAATLFVACAPQVGAGATTSWSTFSTGGNSWEQYPPGVTYSSVFRAARVNAVPTILPYNGAAYQGSSIIIRYRSSSSGWGQFVNGGVSHIAAANYSAAVNNSAIGYTIGADTSGGNTNGPFKGRICEVLAYNESLSDSQCERIERWLSQKWSASFGPRVSNPDAQDWIRRVYLANGTVSSATATAVNTFCESIESAGIRDRFYRLNLFAGNSDASLAAVRTPLFRGPSLGGTQYGGTTDTNNNFVAGDYAENSGLAGNGSTKYLDTGFPTNTIQEGNRHISVYEQAKSTGQYRFSIGSEGASANSQWFSLSTFSPTDYYRFGFGSTSGGVDATSYSGGAMWLGSNAGTGSGTLYKNGVSVATESLTAATPTSSAIWVFNLNRQGTSGGPSNARLGSYSLGLGMNATQAAAYYTAMQAFQTALGRNV